MGQDPEHWGMKRCLIVLNVVLLYLLPVSQTVCMHALREGWHSIEIYFSYLKFKSLGLRRGVI
jgi:hypothetical protein